MNPWLTLIIVNDTVKSPSLLTNFFDAFRLQQHGLEGVQLVVLNQCKDKRHVQNCIGDLPVEIWQSPNVHVGDHALWDIHGDMAYFRPLLRGKWHGLVHKECVFTFDYFDKLRLLLETHDPTICLGNMRRLGRHCDIAFKASSAQEDSQPFRDAVAAKDANKLREVMREAKLCRWQVWWSELELRDRRDRKEWGEDVYFAKTEWTDSIHFYNAEPRLLFQDVYDTMGRALYILGEFKRPVEVYWPKDSMLIYHLHHEKEYQFIRPEVAGYFLRQPEQWRGTFWSTQDYLAMAHYQKDDPQFVWISRNSDYGTTSRFGKAFHKLQLSV